MGSSQFSTTSRSEPSETDERGEVLATLRFLIRALRALGEVGYPARASRLAAEAWAALRLRRPEADHRLVGLLHYLAQLPSRDDDDVPAALNGVTARPAQPAPGNGRGAASTVRISLTD